MIQEDFKDLFRQDVRNTQIVREVDPARQSELWRSFLIGVPLVALLLFSGWQHFLLLQHGYRAEHMREERVRELEISRHLRLEIETLRAPARIERIATEQLNLVAPDAGEAIVIERVVPSPSPEPSVVATRQEPSGGHTNRPR